ncbi:hypothetical protein TNCV_1006201 [Trichonephila clavipes]|nr:hypothetical protein TNCV_1006201 [Trichonephila clavipes]
MNKNRYSYTGDDRRPMSHVLEENLARFWEYTFRYSRPYLMATLFGPKWGGNARAHPTGSLLLDYQRELEV